MPSAAATRNHDASSFAEKDPEGRVPAHPIGTDKEGNEITLIDILGSEAEDVIKEVDLKIEKSRIYRNLDILDEREKEVVVGSFGLDTGGEERTQLEIAKDLGNSRSYVSRIEKRALMKRS